MYMRTEVIVTSCGLFILRRLYTVHSSALYIDSRMGDNDLLLSTYLSIVGVILSVTLRLGRLILLETSATLCPPLWFDLRSVRRGIL